MNTELLSTEPIPPPVQALKQHQESLGGIPLVSVRAMNSSERGQLVRRLWTFRLLNIAVGNIFILTLILSYRDAEWTGALVLSALALMATLSQLIPLERLKSGSKVREYAGRLKNLPLDSLQRRLIVDHHKAFQEASGANVVVLDSSKKIWSVCGKGIWDLKGVDPVQTAINTSLHTLNDAERAELSLHLKRHQNSMTKYHASWLALCFLLSLMVWQMSGGNLTALSLAVCALMVGYLVVVLILSFHPSRSVARALQVDIDAGSLSQDHLQSDSLYLASGIPWIIKGEPSNWRIERSANGLGDFKRLALYLRHK